MKILRNSLLSLMAVAAIGFLSSCEGPAGPIGDPGDPGTDANETCKLCHTPAVVDLVGQQFEWSKHKKGEAAHEEAGRADCAPCHESEAFKYVIANNTPATFSVPQGGTNNVNNYTVPANYAWGDISCYTCHDKLHTTYGMADLALATTAPVSMTYFGGTVEMNLPGSSNLCAKCHQPRPITKNNGASPTGAPINYAALAVPANLNNAFWAGSSASAGTGDHKPGFRSGPHYGVVSSIYAGVGKGGVEFAGGESYVNSWHTANASCSDCHMADMGGTGGGGHTFYVNGNLNGCNTAECHNGAVSTAAGNAYWTTPRANIKALLDQLGGMLKVNHWNGTAFVEYNMVMTDTDTETNLWYNSTTAHYDGYWNIYNSSNPDGQIPNTWFTVTNAQFGAMLNFQLALREYSLGIHNYKYTHALLSNTIEVLGGTPVN